MEASTFENPLREGLRLERAAEPCVVVIFGASGDLTKRKLVPALYNLARERLLANGFSMIGFARSAKNDEQFRQEMRAATNQFSEVGSVDDSVWESFAQGLHYLAADPRDPGGYQKLSAMLEQLDKDRGTSGNRVYYLSTPPNLYSDIVRQLGAAGLSQPKHPNQGWARIIIEKPFGHDLETARALNREVNEVFQEDQVYRIDHYLGKETVQNILALRFANAIFEPIWNRRYIDHVQITAAENIGVENRGGYYEQAGVLRDMIQNHMLQLLALVAMEPPVSLEANVVRDERAKVLHAIRRFTHDETDKVAVRGQYDKGWQAGKPVVGYRSEKDIRPESITETYAAVKFTIDNWRWAEVPFYVRSGKRLPKRVTEIAIQFKRVPHLLFKHTAADQLEPNVLVLRIQPDEGITSKFGAKLPGQSIRIRQVNMDFQYGTSFGVHSPEAYQRLLHDCMLGDSTLFARRDIVEESWSIVMPILETWPQKPPRNFPNYEAGTWGPKEADDFIERDGRVWRRP